MVFSISKFFSVYIIMPLFLILLNGCHSINRAGHRSSPPEDSEVNGEIKEIKAGIDKIQLNYMVYQVRAGDTLFAIGRKFGTDWQDIKSVNRLEDNNITIGQVLLVPVNPEAHEQNKHNDQVRYDSTPTGRPVGFNDSAMASWAWPLKGYIASDYNEFFNSFPMPGILIKTEPGAQVKSAADGKVINIVHRTGNIKESWGNTVAVQHPSNLVSWYAMLDVIAVKEGDKVARGDTIGAVTQKMTAHNPRLAFRIYKNERPVNPLSYLP